MPISVVNCAAMILSTVLANGDNYHRWLSGMFPMKQRLYGLAEERTGSENIPLMRSIFRKALVYSIGYGLFNDTFENGFIFIMDDVGCSEHAWSLRWHYPTPARDTLIKYLIEPLEKYGFMMVQNITSGFC